MSNRQTNRDDQGSVGSAARAQLVAAVPLDEERLDLGGIPTAVLAGGQGPPMVLLHGPGEFGLVWLRIVADLARTHRVVVPDLPGHGASGLGSEPLDSDTMLAWMDALIDRTCSTAPVLVGHLLGGALAARYAAARADRVRELVLVDTMGLRRLRPKPAFALTLLAFMARPSEGTRDRFFRQCFVDMDSLPAQLGPLWAPLMTYALDRAGSAEQKAALRPLMRDFGARAVADEELRRISVPTTLIWGRQDRQTPVGAAEKASARYGWPLHVIDGAADDPAFEKPEALLAVLPAA